MPAGNPAFVATADSRLHIPITGYKMPFQQQIAAQTSVDLVFFMTNIIFKNLERPMKMYGIPQHQSPAAGFDRPAPPALTCTGRGSRLAPNCFTMLMVTLPPNEWPTRTFGKSFKSLSSCSTSAAAESTECGRSGDRLPTDSPWQRRSTSRTCHDGKPCEGGKYLPVHC